MGDVSQTTNVNVPPIITNRAGQPSKDECQLGMIAWVLSIFLHVIGPLVIYLISADKPFTRKHAATALTGSILVGIPMLIVTFGRMVGEATQGSQLEYFIGSGFWATAFVVAWCAALLWFVNQVQGAIKAYHGKEFNPFFVTSIRKSIFKI
jgi:uncharacterized Tic20 family protein